VPTVAEAISHGYPLAGGDDVDGVILVDPLGLAALLRITGPVSVAPWPVPITADNAVQILTFDHYQQLDDEARVQFQSDVVEAIVDRVTVGDLAPPSEIAATLAPAVKGGHLQLWSPDRAEQAFFARIDAAGELRAPESDDFLEVVSLNGSKAKIDYYLRRSVHYTAAVDPQTGKVEATAEVTLTNNAPRRGVDSYIIGGTDLTATAAGENRQFLTVYSALGLVDVVDEQGAPLHLEGLGKEKGLTFAQVVLTIPPGGTRTVRYRFSGGVDLSDGRYRLTLGRQATAWPDAFQVDVTGVEQPGHQAVELIQRTALAFAVGP
jgi:hypothetical protein